MINQFKYLAFSVLSKSGYTIIPNWRLSSYPFAQHLQKIFQTLDIDCVLDVGANIGQYYDFLRTHVGYQGKVVSFEPIPEHVEILRKRAALDKNWTIQGCALGKLAGVGQFNVMANTQFSSFLDPTHEHVSSFKGKNEVSRSIPVDVKTLNEMIPILQHELGFKRIYLKLDTQGFDLEVIGGCHDQLANISALQTEVSVKPIYNDMPNYMDTIQEMQSLGFSISGIYPNNPDHFPEAVEFDYIFVNSALNR